MSYTKYIYVYSTDTDGRLANYTKDPTITVANGRTNAIIDPSNYSWAVTAFDGCYKLYFTDYPTKTEFLIQIVPHIDDQSDFKDVIIRIGMENFEIDDIVEDTETTLPATLADIRSAIDSGAITTEDIWTYLYRTLTPSSVQTASEPIISTVPVELYTYSSNTITVTCIDADEIWYTIKSSAGQTDDQAMLQVSKTGSLLRLDGKSPSAFGLDSSYATLTHSGSSINVFISGSAAPRLNGAGNKDFTGEVKRRMNTGAMPIVSQHPITLKGGLTRSM